MLTEKEIEEIVTTNENNVSIKELALDKGFKEYLTSKIKPLFEKHNVEPFEIFLFYDESKNEICGETDGKMCKINAGHSSFQKFSVQEIYIQILITLFHEAGHLLYTDFSILEKRMKNLELKTDTVKEPKHLEVISDILYKSKNDYEISYTRDSGLPAKRLLISYIREYVAHFQGCAEDKRIEKKLLSNDSEFTEFINAFKAGEKMDADCEWDKEHDEGMYPFEQEALETGNTNFEMFIDYYYWTGRYGETGDIPDKRLYPCSYEAIPVIDKLMTVDDPDKEFDLALELVAIAYPLFEDRILFKTEEEEEEYFRRQALKKQNN